MYPPASSCFFSDIVHHTILFISLQSMFYFTGLSWFYKYFSHRHYNKLPPNDGLWVTWVSSCRVVLGILDWQIASSRDCFVPLSENKKSLGMPELDFLGVTWTATTSHPWLDAALFCHPWQNITVCRQAHQDFLIFSQSHKISFGFAQDASRQVMNTIWVGGSSQNWGRRREFLIFAWMKICLKC